MIPNASTRRLLAWAPLLLGALVSLLPIAMMALNAFKSHAEIARAPLALPTTLKFDNFATAWTSGTFGVGFVNSAILAASTIFIVLVLAAPASYALSRSRSVFARLSLLYFLAATTVPIQMFLFPLFFAYAKLGMIGNVVATSLILAALNLPLSILLLRSYVNAIPSDIDDAAQIDGASSCRTFLFVILPMMRPGLFVVSVIVGLNAWNEFLVTSTFQQGEGAFTMTLGYLSMNGVFFTNQGAMMAGGFIVVAPVMILFLFLQRYFVAGIAAGAIKE